MSVIFQDRQDADMLRGPFVGTDPTDNVDMGHADTATGGK